jgi:cytochrome c-type biogenesis protein CcsB
MKFLGFHDYQFPFLACLCFGIGMISYWVSLILPKRFFPFGLGRAFILLANFLLALTLSLRWLAEGYFPLSNLYESLIFLTWALSCFHALIDFKTRSRIFGGFSSPLLFLLSGFSTLTLPLEMQKALPLVPSLQSNWLMMHVSMMMVSYGILMVGSLVCLFYLAYVFLFGREITESGSIGNFALSWEGHLSFLEILDRWSYRLIGLGFPFLTLGILSGAIWANEAWGAYWSWDPKETWALISWLVFAFYLHSRFLKGWKGEKAAWIGGGGFLVLWICYLGVNFLGKGLHSYGWVL